MYRASVAMLSSDDVDGLEDAEHLASRSSVVSHVGAVLQSVAQKQQAAGRPRSNTVRHAVFSATSFSPPLA